MRQATDAPLTRIAHEIIERNEALESLCLVGILRRGAPIAEQLRALIESIAGVVFRWDIWISPFTGTI